MGPVSTVYVDSEAGRGSKWYTLPPRNRYAVLCPSMVTASAHGAAVAHRAISGWSPMISRSSTGTVSQAPVVVPETCVC